MQGLMKMTFFKMLYIYKLLSGGAILGDGDGLSFCSYHIYRASYFSSVYELRDKFPFVEENH